MTKEAPKRKLIAQTERLLNLSPSLPIDSNEIPDFKHWINFNGFVYSSNNRPWQNHLGYDFAAYLTESGKVVFGLPEQTKIRAVADGTIHCVVDAPEIIGFDQGVWIKHENSYGGLTSGYWHVVSALSVGTEVKRGDVIGTLWKQKEDKETGNLVHLHFEIRDHFQKTAIDPRLIDPSLYLYNMIPPNTVKFQIPELPSKTPFEVAHFKKVETGTTNGQFFRSKQRIA